MARLTGGTFKYTRRIKPGDPNEYNAPFREATAEISWASAEDENEISNILTVMELAQHGAVERVHQMLGKAPESVTLQTVAEEAPAQAAKRGRPKKADVAPDLYTAVAEDATASVKASQEEDLMADPTAPTAVVITTTALLVEITKKNAERLARPEGSTWHGKDGRAPQVIKDLIGQYVKLPQTAHDIAPEVREKFLSELAEL